MIQKDRIIQSALEGNRPAIIAAQLDAPISTVYATIYQARKSGVEIQRFPNSPLMPEDLQRIPRQELRFHVNPDIAQAVHDEAARRGTTSTGLVRDLLEAICDDNLFAALLDQ